MCYNNYNTQVAQLPTKITKDTIIILDTETTGLNKLTGKPFMCLMIIGSNKFAISWSPALVRWLNANLPIARYVVCHNAKYDWHMMRNGGVDADVLYNTNVYCTFVAEALLNEHRHSYSLDNLAMEYFGIGKDLRLYTDIGEYFGVDKPDKKVMARVAEFAAGSPENWHRVAAYGIDDVIATAKLFNKQGPELRQQELGPLFELEMRTLKALVEVELRGVCVDVERVEEVEEQLNNKQGKIQESIINMLGWEVNPRSPNDMVNAFTKLGLPITYTKKSGNPTFAKEILAEIDHPFMTLLQESRNVKTMLDTFIGGSIGKSINGRIHTDFNQVRGDDYGTGTGRLSSSGPNLQQIPKRDGELAPLVRGLFCPPPGKLWIANDWEQFEYRVFAHYVKDPNLTAQYITDPHTDFHTATAELTGKPRDKAKRINLGLVFGMGEGKLAKELGLPFTIETKHGKEILIAGPEAQELFNEYHSRFPYAKSFLKEASHIAKSRGYVKTIMGRRLRFPNGQFVHKAGGLIFQGTSADIMKKKLYELNDEFRNTDVDFNLIVHDEFCANAPEEIAQAVARKIKEITENVPELRIPILADSGIGKTWWEAK